MKHFLYISLVLIFALGVLIAFVSPTLNHQVAFNEYLWRHCPATRIRYYMSDSLLTYLDTQQPTYTETHRLLGEDFWDTWPDFEPDTLNRPRTLYYELKRDLIDLYGSSWRMAIEFDENGNYQAVDRWHED